MLPREPAGLIEAVICQAGTDGSTQTVFVPVGHLWRAAGGGYFGELKREPLDWSYSPDRRLFLRFKEK